MGNSGGRGCRYCAGAEEVHGNARKALHLVFKCLQGHPIQGVVEMVCAGGSDSRVFSPLPSRIHRICRTVQLDSFEPPAADVGGGTQVLCEDSGTGSGNI